MIYSFNDALSGLILHIYKLEKSALQIILGKEIEFSERQN